MVSSKLPYLGRVKMMSLWASIYFILRLVSFANIPDGLTVRPSAEHPVIQLQCQKVHHLFQMLEKTYLDE